MRRPTSNKSLSGISLMEMLVSLVILTMIISLAFGLLNTSNRMIYSNKLYSNLKEEGQRAIRYLDRDLIRAKKIFGRDTNYHNILPTGIPEKVNFSTLPVLNPVGTFDQYSPDFTDTIFGNELLFAKIENSIQIDVPGGNSYELNLYKFINVYLTMDYNRTTRPYGYSLAMIKWESENVADFWELDHLNTNFDKDAKHIERILGKDHNINYSWDPSQKNYALAFYEIGEYSTPTSVKLTTAHYSYIIRGVNQTLGISFNASDSFPVKDSVPGLSRASGMFPAGAEFGVIGPTSSRKVLIRLVLAGWTRSDIQSYVSTTMVSAPEY